ncbi:MAG: hypothetical protein M3T96_00520, partial [Acidobacteriota bacterium]|nr:hypothetical protein [Acidobacteriota bacterium]
MSFSNKIVRLFPIVLLFSTFACQTDLQSIAQTGPPIEKPKIADTSIDTDTAVNSDEIKKLLKGAVEQTKITKGYDPRYIVLKY